MQITDTVDKRGLSTPSYVGRAPASDIPGELQHQRSYHKRILLRRKFENIWYPMILVLVAAIASALIGQYLVGNVRTVLCSLVVVGVFIVALKNIQAGFLLTAIVSTAWLPKVTAFGTLDIYPSLILIVLLFWLLVVQISFHVHKPYLPSFWVLWPQLGLIFLAIAAEIMIQFTWIAGVSHELAHKYTATIISNPVVYDEILGVWMYTLPLTILVITTTVIQKKEAWIEYVLRALMMLGVLGSAIIIYEFRRKGATVDTFRTAEPSVLWMTLRSLSQLLVQVTIIAYSRFLYATRARWRIFYGLIALFCLVGIYLSLQNSWWVEVAVGMIAMTVIYSRRLITFCIVCIIPLLPLVKLYLDRLQTVKKNDLNRFTIWHDAFWAWTRRPILGFGPGNYWVYDQFYTTLPRNLRNLTLTGLGVAHDGYLQVLVETGPLGVFCYIASTVLIAIAAYRLYRRFIVPRKHYTGFLGLVDLGLAIDPEAPKQRQGRTVKMDFIVSLKSKLRGMEVTDRGLEIRARYKIGTWDFFWDSILRLWNLFWGKETSDEVLKRRNCMLGLCAFGLIIGSAFGDLTSSSFFLPPRQLNQFVESPQVIVSWMIFGFAIYKDKLWRMARRKATYGKPTSSNAISNT